MARKVVTTHMVRKPITTIQLHPETKSELIDLGAKNETYDAVIRRLIKAYRESSDV